MKDQWKARRHLAVAIIGAALAVTACGAAPGRGVGSQPPPVTLTLANGNHGHEFLEPFADAIETTSGGTVTIEFRDEVRKEDPAYETAIIDDVEKGRFDLGWAAVRPWRASGVTAFDALMAPFLVDSHDLQDAVLASDVQDRMLAGLNGTGLVGLGILAGPLRYVATADAALDGPDALRGKAIGIGDSDIARMTFEALGAKTEPMASGVELGDVDAVEAHLGAILGNRYHEELPRITTDIALWPRPIILFANASRLAALTGEQRAAITGAARAIPVSARGQARAEDAAAVQALCSDGATLTTGGDAARQRLRTAVQSVYDALASDPSTRSMIQQITDLKTTIAPMSAPSCPVATGSGPSAVPSGGPSAGGIPDGAYEARISADEMKAYWDAHSVPISQRTPCPCTQTFSLRDGVWTGGDGSTWSVSFFADHLTLTDREGSITVRWRHDAQHATVTFSEVQSGDPHVDVDLGTYFLVKPFVRVGP